MNNKIKLTDILIKNILKDHDANIEFLFREKIDGKYYGNFKCNSCEKLFKRKICSSIIENLICPKCQIFTKENIKKRKSVFLNNAKKNGNFDGIELIGEYINKKTDTTFYCNKCDTTFLTKPFNFLDNRACPICNPFSRKNIYGEVNNIYNSNKKMYSFLFDKKDGQLYGEQSFKKVKWICPNCNNVVEQSPCSVYRNGVSCKLCGDGVSYPNKFFVNLLKCLKLKFIPEKIFDWAKTSQNRYYRYDFYLPKYNLVIEAMGIQHYQESSFKNKLEEIKNNDITKEILAKKNGITAYIKIDCSYSNVDFIKNSILNSELSNIFDMSSIDWFKVGILSDKSILVECCKEYDKHPEYTPKDLAKKFNVVPDTITSYLKKGKNLGICSYTKVDSRSRMYKSIRKYVDQYTLDGKYIKTFHGIREAERELNIKYIVDVLRGKSRSVGGYVWKYSDGRR